MKSPMTDLLKLPSVTVVSSFSVEDAICFELKILASSMVCPHCGQSTKELHQIRPILVRDLPVFGQPADLKIPRRNFYCRHCQKYVTERLEFLNKQPESVRDCVLEVSVDMWGGFPKVIEEVFPNAAIVIDRFHVMKLVNGQLNKIRRLAGVKPAGSRYLLLKNQADLTSVQKEQLALILKHSVCLSIAYEMKEEFRKIYETSKTVAEGRTRMEKWLESAELFYGKTARTIRQHLAGICNYFMNRTTSGVMEGINNKIKLIMRNGYGFHNSDNLRSRLLGCFSSSG